MLVLAAALLAVGWIAGVMSAGGVAAVVMNTFRGKKGASDDSTSQEGEEQSGTEDSVVP